MEILSVWILLEKIDGVEFDGGKSEDYVFDPNYDNFIDGFYEQIIGHTPSEERVRYSSNISRSV